MSDLHARIRAAQINAGEMAVVQDLHDRGLCDPVICEICKQKMKTAVLAPLDHWPWCPTCKQPFEFEPLEPFAYCGCGTTEWGNPRPAEYVRPPMPRSLEDKLAVMVWYLDEVRNRRRGADPIAFESYLNDSEVANWLDRMQKQGRIVNSRFTEPTRPRG